jgi:hypothetical protein
MLVTGMGSMTGSGFRNWGWPVAGRKHLVVVIPGIGGSVLQAPGPSGEAGVVWDAGFRSLARLGFAAGRLSLAELPKARAVGLIRSRGPLPGWTVIRGYERLMAALGGLPGAVVDDGHPDRRVPDANVVAFPYDFRQSLVAVAEELARDISDRLSVLGAAGEPGRVVFVAHSLGGLVARYWLGPLEGWRVCRALITLGTPHRGSPKALNWQVGGVRLGGLEWAGMTGLIREWPSAAELMPRYPAIWDETADAARYPHELPISWLQPKAVRAFGVHEDIAAGCDQIPQSGPEMVPRIGWSHATLDAAFWDGSRLRVHKRPPRWLDAPGWEHDFGDGTVPAISALPIELDNRAVSTTGVRVRERHGSLAAAKPMIAEIMRLLHDYEERPVPGPSRLAYRDAEERSAALGLDVDDLYVAGEPIPLQVRIRGTGSDVSSTTVAVSLRPVDGPATSEPGTAPMARLTWDATADGFTGELTAVQPGVFDLTVTAEAVPGAGDLTVTESVAVMEG